MMMMIRAEILLQTITDEATETWTDPVDLRPLVTGGAAVALLEGEAVPLREEVLPRPAESDTAARVRADTAAGQERDATGQSPSLQVITEVTDTEATRNPQRGQRRVTKKADVGTSDQRSAGPSSRTSVYNRLPLCVCMEDVSSSIQSLVLLRTF